MRKHITTKEEKAVVKITDIISDLRLDLEKIGYYLAYSSDLMYNRLQIIFETATAEKEKQNGNNTRK